MKLCGKHGVGLLGAFALALGTSAVALGTSTPTFGFVASAICVCAETLSLGAAFFSADTQMLGALAGGVHRDTGVLDSTLQALELSAVAAAQPAHALLGLGPELLLGILALLGAAQLVLAIGELLIGALALSLCFCVATTKLGGLAFERVNGSLSDLGAARLLSLGGFAGGTGAAGAALSKDVANGVSGTSLAWWCAVVSIGDHCLPAYGDGRTPRTVEVATRCASATPCAIAATKAR